MNDAVYEKYKLAGKIAAQARNFGVDLIKPGVSFLDVANSVESKILKSGAGIAFPVNISINEIAAHFSPRHDETLVFKKGDVVKLDVGAHVDGFIADTAITVEVETHNYDDLIKSSSDALDAAINLMKSGVNLSDIGKAVESQITSYGFKPVENLSGHSLTRYCLHSGMSIPNVADMFNKTKPKLDDVIAIEPFASDGSGHVISGEGSNIYLCSESIKARLVRDNKSKIIFNKIKNKFKTLPFAQRWAEQTISNSNFALRKLTFLGLLKHFPQLIDSKKGIVSQKEHTVIVKEEGCEVMT